MTSVFIGGSRRLGRVNGELAYRLNNIMDKRLRVLVGDANGFDRAAQAYLADNGYRDVVIYCTAGVCRNNIGGWPIHAVEYGGRDRGFEFYTAKDDAMLREADYGLFAWDGKSKGTLRNVRNMAELGKPSVVYISTTAEFAEIRTAIEAERLAEHVGSGTVETGQLFTDQWRASA